MSDQISDIVLSVQQPYVRRLEAENRRLREALEQADEMAIWFRKAALACHLEDMGGVRVALWKGTEPHDKYIEARRGGAALAGQDVEHG